MKTVAQEYVEKAKKDWWKALLYKGYAIIEQTEKKNYKKYCIYDVSGEFIETARTQYQAKLFIDGYINE